MNVDTSSITRELPSCGIRIDSEGNWFYEGRPIIREDILDLFYSNLHFSPEKGFWIEWQGQACLLDVEDTPFIIIDVDRRKQPGAEEYFEIRLKHIKETERLDPETLFVGKNNVLYCKIKGGRLKAKFSRPAYYRFSQWIEEENGKFYVSLNGKRYYIVCTCDY